MRVIILVLFITLVAPRIYSQGFVSGKVIDQASKTPLSQIKVQIVGPFYNDVSITDQEGMYKFENLATGAYTVLVSQEGFFEVSESVDYIAGEETVMPDLAIERNVNISDATNDIPLSDAASDDESAGGGNAVASLINSSRDVFAFNASTSWFIGRFNFRGQNDQEQMMYLNGIPIRDINYNNRVTYTDYTGLNDIMRVRTNYYGLKAIPFTFGELTNSVNVDAEAIYQQKGFRFGQWLTNRSYITRTSLSYNTGLMKNNWAMSFAGSFRGGTGFMQGTNSQVFSGYFSVSKKWSQKFNSSLSIVYNDNLRETAKASTKEFYQLAGTHYYNPNWGEYQNRKRSASLRRDNAPIISFSNKWDLSNKTKIAFALGYQFGKRYRERLDWYNSYSPDPTYYRNQPSYYIDNPYVYNLMVSSYQNDPSLLQVDWDRLYEANQNVNLTVPGNGTTGKWARYLMYKDMNTFGQFTFNGTVNHILTDHIALNGGLTFQLNNSEFYKQASDLLGADFYVNINQFAQRLNPSDPNAIQNNLNTPYQIIHVGDKYGFDYKSTTTQASIWGQSEFSYNKVDFFLSFMLNNQAYRRDGIYRNGAYANNSQGNSPTKSFFTTSFKGGVTYKLNGKNYFTLNAAYLENPPLFNQVFVLARTTNIIAEEVKKNQMYTGELSYNFRGPRLKISATGFYVQNKNLADARSIYTELTNSFGTMLLNNISERYVGFEGGVDAKIGNTGFTITEVINVGDYYYSDRPTTTFFYDNLNKIYPTETIYFKNLHLATGPQFANTFKVSYFSKQYWNLSLAINYFDKIYVDPSPQRRTLSAVDGVDPNSELYKQILTQERLPSAATVDLYFRKSFLLNKTIKSLKHNTYLDLNFSVSNLFNNKNFLTSGTEQLRFDFTDRNPEKYPNKYFYAFGLTYSLNILLRF